MNTKKAWSISIAVSVIFAVLLIFMWYLNHTSYNPNPSQLIDESTVERFLDNGDFRESATILPTSIFVQSLHFKSATEVGMTGILWQTYNMSEHEHIARGFFFPEEVDYGNLQTTVMYSQTVGDKQTIGWFFDSTLRQKFDYDKYPLDHKTVWIRVWPKDFEANVMGEAGKTPLL